MAATHPLPPGWALPAQSEADRELRTYLEERVSALESASALQEMTPESWPAERERLRTELKEMLGLVPEPPREDLRVEVTGTLEGDGFVVEKMHFQPVPGLYLAANLYRPAQREGRLPAVLYLCGHAGEIHDGVSHGNKTHYHPHGVWFARHGYVCLILDTIQWGELLGEHHGTYRLGRWWWVSRGYTPAGVEAWNAIRALDYLQGREEVDPARMGVTGRSGGGAYTWWVTALDDRVAVAAPTAGIATLRNHVLDGCVEGHCDCMFMQNTYRWDFDRVAALAAPRPLLIVNTDKDDIFPLDGVYDIHRKTASLYQQLGKTENLGLHIAEGPHKDMQTVNMGAFAWFERFLKGADPMAVIAEPARATLATAELRVFERLPEDERTTRIDETFVAAAAPELPENNGRWREMEAGWRSELAAKVFRARVRGRLEDTGSDSGHPGVREHRLSGREVLPARVWIAGAPGDAPALLDVWEGGSAERCAMRAAFLRKMNPGRVVAVMVPAGSGVNSWSGDERKRTHLRRRLLLLGETLGSLQAGQIADVAAAVAGGGRVEVHASGALAVAALHAAVQEPAVGVLDLHGLPASHREGPEFLNVLKILDLPQVVALAATRARVTLRGTPPGAVRWAQEAARRLGWEHPPQWQEPPRVLEVRRIWDGAEHAAFTDLLRRGGEWFCVFREGSGHVPGTDGVIRVLRSADGAAWESAAVLSEAGTDLRDPKISLRPDGTLMLLMGGSSYGGESAAGARRALKGALGRVAFSADGRSWSAPRPLEGAGGVSLQDRWLWRVTWQGGRALGAAYPVGAGFSSPLEAFASGDGVTFFSAGKVGPVTGGAGLNEATLRFSPEGREMWLVRGEQADRHSFFGVREGEEQWWTDVGAVVQGPEMLVDADGRLWFAGRSHPDGSARTVLGELRQGLAQPLVTLPSGGDCSYPGMAQAEDGSLWVSYYSSHEGKSAIYLARVAVP